MTSITALAKRLGKTVLFMKASMKMERKMAMVGSYGLMVAFLRAISSKTEWKEQEPTIGMTDDATQETGKTT